MQGRRGGLNDLLPNAREDWGKFCGQAGFSSGEKKKSCVWYLWLMGFWWGPECSRPLDRNLFVRYDCSDIELGGGNRRQGMTMWKKDWTIERLRSRVGTDGVWGEMLKGRCGQCSAITQPVRASSFCTRPLSWSSSATRLFLTLSLLDYFLTFSPSCPSVVDKFKHQKHNMSHLKGRGSVRTMNHSLQT